jgi:hypothetical protein
MSDWIMLDKARQRTRGAEYKLNRFLARGRVHVTAKRYDRPFEPPDRVETLLAEAEYINILDNNMIRVWAGPWLVSNLLTEVRVYWPQLTAELEAAGYAVARRRQNGGNQTRSQRKEPAQRSAINRQERGPKQGATGFTAADEALCPEIDQMLKSGKVRSASDAALSLAQLPDKVSGGGSPQSRATRLARRYGKRKKPNATGS